MNLKKFGRREYLLDLVKLIFAGTISGAVGGVLGGSLVSLYLKQNPKKEITTSTITEYKTEYVEKSETIYKTETLTETYTYVPKPEPIVRSLVEDNPQMEYRIWNRHDTDTGIFVLMGAEVKEFKWDELIVKGYESWKEGEKKIVDRLTYDYSVITLENDSITHAFHPSDVIENNVKRSRENMLAGAVDYFKDAGKKHIHCIGYSGGGNAIAEQLKEVNKYIDSVTWINVPFELNFKTFESAPLFKQLSKGELIKYISFPCLVICGDQPDERFGDQILRSNLEFFAELMNSKNMEIKTKSKLKILKGFGHDINVDNGTELITEAVNDFIRSLY